MKCDRCGSEITAEESYTYFGETLCEDCYIDVKYPSKVCDPWAVYSATRSRERLGLKGTQGLNDLHKQIYEFIRRNGKATREELMKNCNMTESELQTQVAILKHCELVKGHKNGHRVYLVPFD
jgi:recombinational DNA repair protein (RecF pathway)